MKAKEASPSYAATQSQGLIIIRRPLVDVAREIRDKQMGEAEAIKLIREHTTARPGRQSVKMILSEYEFFQTIWFRRVRLFLEFDKNGKLAYLNLG